MDLLSAMRIYVRVVERGSLSAAARDLGLGQPAVSERIALLEKHLDARLLDRTTRSLKVTDVGALFYERARQAIEAVAEAEAAVSSADQRLQGTLRVAAPHGLGEILLPPVLLELQAAHPALKIDLVLNDRFVDPLAEGVDLSLRVGHVGDGGFVAHRLGAVERLLLAAPAYLERHGRPATPEDLAAHPLIRIAGLTSDERMRLIGPSGAVVTAPIRTAWRANHWRPLFEAVRAGAGLGVLQRPSCAQALETGELIQVLPDYRLPLLDVHAIHPAARRVPLRTRSLLALLRERLGPVLGGRVESGEE
jgi:DNA-binding transcriptional LysR family regulator